MDSSTPKRTIHDVSSKTTTVVRLLHVFVCLVGLQVVAWAFQSRLAQPVIMADIKQKTSGTTLNSPFASQYGHAIVHAGIHKTGSTAIQTHSSNKYDFLKMDGFEMPWMASKERNRRPRTSKNNMGKNQVNFATCFIEPNDLESLRYPCDPDLLSYGLDIASRNRNLFVSAETFDKLDSEGIDRLAQYLAHWKTKTIVVFYRRYYDWTASTSQQWEISVLDLLDENVHEVPFQYTSELVPRLRKVFGDNVLVMNYHDKSSGGSDRALFCHPSFNMTNTCRSFATNQSDFVANVGVNRDYGDLAYGANKTGLLNISSIEQMKQITEAVRAHHESVLHSGAFKRICAPQKTLNRLWTMSLSFEKMFVPGPINETEFRSDFNKITTTKLCKIDVSATLAEDSWIAFFKPLS